MKTTIITYGLLLLFLAAGCTPPTDVDAYRRKKITNPPTDDLYSLQINNEVIDFGIRAVGSSQPTPLVLHNISSLDSIVIRDAFLAQQSQHFSVIYPKDFPPLYLGPQDRTLDNKLFYVDFYPQAPGNFVDTLFFNKAKKKYVVLRGCAVEEGDLPRLGISPAYEVLNFGGVEVNWSQDIAFTIVNLNPNPVTISGIMPSGGNSGFEYTIKYPPGQSFPIRLGPSFDDENNHMYVSLTFKPKQVKDYSQKLKITIGGFNSELSLCDIIARGIIK